jgi:hypothetical protein
MAEPSPPAASAVRSQVEVGGTPSRTQVSGEGALKSRPSSPRAAAGPARHGSTAKSHVGGEDRPAPPAGGIRVFIHHVAGHRGGAALAQRSPLICDARASPWRTSGRSILDAVIGPLAAAAFPERRLSLTVMVDGVRRAAPSISMEGQPWSTMPRSTARWNGAAFAWSMRPARSSAKPRCRASARLWPRCLPRAACGSRASVWRRGPCRSGCTRGWSGPGCRRS